jgi:Periplasmic binding protein
MRFALAPVSGIRVAALVAAIAAALGMLATTAAGRERSAATEVGITATEIHVAVIADVDNPIAPNVFIGARDAMLGFARYINASCATKNRCLAGRKLVVDFYDSKLNPNETREAEIQACTSDFAMVGTSAVFLNSVDDMRTCQDKAGIATGIPDIPFVTAQLAQQCSDQSFPIAPPVVECATKDEHPQTFQANVGRGYYFTEKYGDLHGIYVFEDTSQGAHDSEFASLGALRDLGGVDHGVSSDVDIGLSGTALQSEYTPVIDAVKAQNSNYAQCANPYPCTVDLRKEAALQGITDQVKVWDCGVQCYDKKFLQSGGTDVEHEYVDTPFLPFYDSMDQHANPMLANFVHYTGKDKVGGFGDYVWSAAVAFRDAVNAIVKIHGVNGLTRTNLFAALNHIHKFDADGMLAPIDLAGRRTSDCHVLTQVSNGAFVRVQPTEPGTFDCNPKYVITRKLDLFVG